MIAASGISIHYKCIPDDISRLLEHATAEDLQDISGIKSVSRQAEIIATRLLAREMFPDKQIVAISHHDDGSPYIPESGYNISVSHCKGMVAIACHPRYRIGIDIERWRNSLLKIKPRFLSTEEMEFYVTQDKLLLAWTAKEAVYKAAGCKGLDFANGISLPLSETDNTATLHLPDRDIHFSLYTRSTNGITTTVAVPSIP